MAVLGYSIINDPKQLQTLHVHREKARSYTIKDSISKTGKVLVVYEDNLTNGPGAELCSVIADRYFEYLDGPIKRVASKDSPVPYNWFLEDDVLVQVSDISNAIKELLEY